MKKIILLIPSCLYFLLVIAQTGNGKISGTIHTAGGQPAVAATVLLLRQNDSSVVKSALPDKQGQFEFNRLADGKYIILVTAVGFSKYSSNMVELNVAGPVAVLPPVNLIPVPKDLTAVKVAAQKPFIERTIDKLVINVASSPVNAGQSAFDVLEKSPGVMIDENDNISLNGKQGTAIFIDGKMSYLTGKDLTNYLRSIPAAQLDQVELMTRPSSKYDAAGISGIINLKTKKNLANGFNGSINTSAIFGYYFKNRDNLTLNWKKNKFNTTFNYGFSYTKNFIDQQTTREFRKDYGSGFNSYQQEDLYFLTTNLPHNFRITTDYTASKNTTLGFGLNGFFTNNKPGVTGTTDIFDSLHNKVNYNTVSTEPHNSVSNLGFNVNLQQKLDKKGKELTADADYVFYHNVNNQVSANNLYNNSGNLQDPLILKDYIPAKLDIYSIKVDYTQPLKKEAKLEAGIKSSYVKTDNNGQYSLFDKQQARWITDTGRSNHFIYNENINAAYVNYNKKINKKWSLQAGLRLEQTNAKGNQATKNIQFEKNYTQLFPTIFLGYTANKNNTFNADYGRGINRPGYQDLNPFQYLVDQFNIREGNPGLQPMFTNDFEVSYNYKNQLNVSAGYTTVKGAFALINSNVEQGNNHIIIQTRQNIGFRRLEVVGVNYSHSLKKWWNFTGSAFLFNNYFSGYPDADLPATSATVCIMNVTNQFPMKKGWTLDASGIYRSKRLEGAYSHALPTYSFSFGAAKKILKNNGTLTLNMNDPFWLMRTDIYTEQSTFYSKTNNHPENRWMTITFNYRFGKTTNQKRRNTGSSQDEQSRVNF
ncbi:MAG: TonB-dependent receptor [Bacteroidota bacterium]|nr:TonB-dependent receptor [Bacteroidota bacterium]